MLLQSLGQCCRKLPSPRATLIARIAMLLQFVLSAFVVVTSLANPVTTTSLCPNVSGCYCEGLSAHCTGNNTVYAHAVQDLPSHLETLVFNMLTAASDMGLDLERGGGLGRFWNLQVLRIQPYSTDFKHGYGINNVTASVLCPLTNLKELHLNALMTALNVDAFQCLQTLSTLDLSYTRGLHTDDLKAVLAAPLSPHITTLLLRNVQRFNDPKANMRKVDFAQLFRGLNRQILRVLDLADNALTDLKPGLLLMPRLEKLDLSNNLLPVQYTMSMTSRLTLLEAVIHPRLEQVICMEQGFYPRNKYFTKSIKETLRKVNDQNEKSPTDTVIMSLDKFWKSSSFTAPDLLTELKKTTSLGGQRPVLSNIMCTFNIQNIPVGKHLSVLNFRGFSQEARPYLNAIPHGTTLCLSPDNNLRVIDVSDNQLALFVDDPSFTNITFSGLRKLEVFKAKNNGLTAHYRTILNPAFPSLRTVLLGGNQLKLGPLNFKSNKSRSQCNTLQNLDLSQNGLSTIVQEEFLFLPNLLLLDLSGNRLKQLNLWLPESLQLLNISGNRLVTLGEDTVNYLDTFHNLTVDVTNNNFVCGCKAYHFIHWIQHTKTKLTDHNNLYCFTEMGQMRMMYIDLQALYKECHPLTPVELGAIGAGCSIALCVVLLAGVVIYRRRWRIRYCFYRRRLRREWAELDDDYEYDAFVAYSADTPEVRRWVNETMRTELEENRGLRLFIHQRDLPLSGFLFERIDDAMRRCRKTVLVLSPDFLKSRTCLYQAWSAYTSMVTEQRDAVVLVKHQQLPAAEIGGTLATLLEIKECLAWTEDLHGQDLFWERLENAVLSLPNT